MNPGVGWWMTLCCCRDAEQIESKERLDEVIEDEDRTFFKTEQEMINKACSCEGKCFRTTTCS